jgi:hypothetical protein
MEQKKVKSELVVTIKDKKRPRFKAGTELADKVNLVAIEVDEEVTEDTESLFISVHIQRSASLAADLPNA